MRLTTRATFVVLPALAVALAACGGGGQADTPEGRIAHERHENFERIGDSFKTATDELKKAAPDLAVIRASAGAVNALAPQVATWFPAGSGPADGIKTDALQAIWEKPDQFKEAAVRFTNASAQFNAAAQAGDLAAIGKAAQEMGGSCKNCHDSFREKD